MKYPELIPYYCMALVVLFWFIYWISPWCMWDKGRWIWQNKRKVGNNETPRDIKKPAPDKKCPRCSQTLVYWHKGDDPDGLCEHCQFMFSEIYKQPIESWKD